MGVRRRARDCSVAVLGAALAAACATTQHVPLDCITEEMRVFVDGQLLEGDPDSIRLGIDAPHKLYIKRPGHPPQLVVLVPEETGDGIRLVPEDVCLELVPVGVDRALTIEAEDPPSDQGR